jgi:CBS domain-containing membrane protein
LARVLFPPLNAQGAIFAGAFSSILLIGAIGRLLLGGGFSHAPLLALPIGASVVLVFAASASPLAQPRGVIGGNIISSLVGLAIGWLVPVPMLAAALAVAAAISIMSLLKCLHPPGGASALGGALLATHNLASSAHYTALVALCSTLLVLMGWLLVNRIEGRSYPHKAHPQPPPPADGVTLGDIEQALARYGELLDVSAEDLEVLFHDVERRAHERLHGRIACREIMTSATGAAASSAVRVAADAPMEMLLPLLSTGAVREAAVADENGVIVGVISQTDLLAALYRAHLVETAGAKG